MRTNMGKLPENGLLVNAFSAGFGNCCACCKSNTQCYQEKKRKKKMEDELESQRLFEEGTVSSKSFSSKRT